MKISELLPCGAHAPGCIMLQGPADNGKLRVVWWGRDESGQWWTHGSSIVNIVEEEDADLPEPLLRAFLAIVSEIFSNPTTARNWRRGSLSRAIKRARTVLDLQGGPEGYDKALRAKGRLGLWLQP